MTGTAPVVLAAFERAGFARRGTASRQRGKGDYREHLVRVLAGRALTAAAGG